MLEGDTKQALGNNASELAEEAAKWLESEQAQRLLSEAIKQATEVTDRLADEERLDPRRMHDPVTL